MPKVFAYLTRSEIHGQILELENSLKKVEKELRTARIAYHSSHRSFLAYGFQIRTIKSKINRRREQLKSNKK